MRLLNKYLILLIYLGINGCLEPFNPEVPDGDRDFLVVDGLITDQPGPYTVKIAKSSSLDGEGSNVSGVVVSIEERDGETETLTEIGDGVYETRALQGKTGKSYRLNLNYRETLYQSTWETLLLSPPIDSVYFQIETKGTTDIDNDVEGLQFFLDNQGPDDGTRYFRFELEETWKIGVYWPTVVEYIGDDQTQRTSDPRHTCWKYFKPTSINIATTDGLISNVLSRHKLNFITGIDERFTRRYSLLVKQYAIKEEEYLFWKNLKESNEDLGSLFDKQPARVTSNLTNVTNPDDIVLGYFSASGVREERIYVNKSEVTGSLSARPFCANLDTLFKSDFDSPEAYERTLFERINSGRRIFYGFYYNELSGILSGALLSLPRCSDCTLKGGDLNKPDFWDE